MKNKATLARIRAEVFQKTRRFFESRNFVEIHTPTLVPNPGLEPHLEYFETQFTPSMGGGQKQEYFLPTSPEYHLKKALSWEGLPLIYEITKSFRNGEISEEHEPEFFMLEWYRCPGSYKEIAIDFEALVIELGNHFNPQKRWGPAKHISVAEAFKKYANLDLDLALSENGESLMSQARKLGYQSIFLNEPFEDAFHKILVQYIEPQLGIGGIEFLWDYPAAFAALSRPVPNNHKYCERFEVYFEGIEIANAFGELMDVEALRAVCQKDQAQRMQMYGKTPPLDEEFLSAVQNTAHKEAGGVAVGFDRLIQILIDAETLQDALLFSKRQN